MNFTHSHGVGIILVTAFYPTPRSLSLLFYVVRPSYPNDIWYHVSVWNCTTSYPNLLLTYKCKVVGVPVWGKAAYFVFLFDLTINYSNIFRIFQIIFFYVLSNSTTWLLKFPQSTPLKLRCPLVHTPIIIFQCPSFPQHYLAPIAASVLGLDAQLPCGAQREIRTLTTSRPVDFKSTVSTVPPSAHITALVQPKSLIFSF